jgi:multidrug efflux pump
VRRFNLSEWALNNRSLVLFAMMAFAIIGAWSYKNLGQSEDPPFTFKVMVVKTLLPGATADQVARQVTEPVEKALMNTGGYEFIRSYSRPGESQVIFMARDAMPPKDVPGLWYDVRKKVGDARASLPNEVIGPFFNDEFGDTFGNIYALTGEGFDYALMRDYADRIQLELQRVADVGKVELIGLQDEKVWIELSNIKLATLGVSMQAVQQALQQQNALAGSSFIETPTDRVQMRVTGQFQSLEDIVEFPIRAGDRVVRLGDIAEVTRGFSDPAAPKMRFMGEDAIGLAVAMKAGGDILKLGKTLDAEFARLQQTLPAGMALRKVSDQPVAVKESVGEFVKVLAEAVIIVLLVSFFSLGFRTGLVVGLSIPLVLAMTFFVMHQFNIGLHKISLGALVLALGLLVDDAIIAVEMMATKMEQGYDRLRAASFAWESTAFPMLTGTLITAAGFLPIGFAQSTTGEYTRSLFQVVTIALVVSWFAAVLFIPYLGDKMLPDLHNPQPPKPDSLAGRWHARRLAWADRYPAFERWLAPQPVAHDHDPYQSAFYNKLRTFLAVCLRHRWWVIAATVTLFAASLFLFRFVPQQFFPDSTRPELMVDIELAEGASLKATQAQAEKLEAMLKERAGLTNYVAYVGTGSPRFYLPLDQQLPATNFAQFVLLAQDSEARESTRAWLLKDVFPQFADIQMRVTRLENGPPVGYPIQLRVSGEDIPRVQAIARQVAEQVRRNPHVANVNLDWDEPSKVVRLVVDQDRARVLGVSSAQLSQFLSSSLAGSTVSVYREGNRQIEMVLRGPEDERAQLDMLASLAIPTASGKAVSLSQVANLEYTFEDGIIWHRDRLPTVTVRADITDGELPVGVVGQILPSLEQIRADLPAGYLLQVGGTIEDSARGQNSIKA